MTIETQYKIAIVDDEKLFLKGLNMMINDHEKLSTDIIATDGRDLIEQLKKSENNLPDALLCDIEMPHLNGVEVTKILTKEYPSIKVIILSTHYESELILKMMDIGAAAFIPKNEEINEFYETIISVIEKGFHYNEFVVRLIREKMLFGTKSKVVDLIELTDREIEVLKLICNQKTNKEIGVDLFISSRTVEAHRKKLLEKTQAKNTVGLIIYAIERGYYSINLKNSDW